MKKHAIRIGAERVLLSEVLPYELPVAFSNRSFASIIRRMNPQFTDSTIHCAASDVMVQATFALITGAAPEPNASNILEHSTNGGKIRTVPLTIDVGKNDGGVRKVSLLHPLAQLAVMHFYETYAPTIIYYCNRSPYSIRYPTKVAATLVHRDYLFAERVDRRSYGVEQEDREYERLRSFFIYGGYSHIYKFYESPEARKLERQFDLASHVDIIRCFDSIYSHSISWATNGVEHSKSKTRFSTQTFGGQFDALMQSINDLETNGIPIGPEVSRLFAEVILQQVDLEIDRDLRRAGLSPNNDFAIRRFMDDYFIYADSKDVIESIIHVTSSHLAKFKLYLNPAKRTDESTPLASNQSVAKHHFRKYLQQALRIPEPGSEIEGDVFAFSAAEAILSYKGLLLSFDVDNGSLANYALAFLEAQLESVLRSWDELLQSSRTSTPQPSSRSAQWSRMSRVLTEAVDFACFIYSGTPSASHSVKLARMAHMIHKFLEKSRFPPPIEQETQSRIVSSLGAEIRRKTTQKQAPMAALVLLDSLTPLETGNVVTVQGLRHLLGLDDIQCDEPNAVALLTAIRFCMDRPQLRPLQRQLVNICLERIYGASPSRRLDTESTFLWMSLLSSPAVRGKEKRRLLERLGFTAPQQVKLHTLEDLGPIDWRIPDYYEALQLKRSADVY